jgi:hypothetical protein
VSDKVRSDKKGDKLYRLLATHYRLVTGAGKSYYPLGYMTEEKGRWKLHPAIVTEGKTQITDLQVLREYDGKTPNETVLWVYRLPQPLPEDADLSGDESEEDEEAAKAALEEKCAPNYIVFRRTAICLVANRVPNVLPLTAKEEAAAKAKAAAAEKKKADAAKAKAQPKT